MRNRLTCFFATIVPNNIGMHEVLQIHCYFNLTMVFELHHEKYCVLHIYAKIKTQVKFAADQRLCIASRIVPTAATLRFFNPNISSLLSSSVTVRTGLCQKPRKQNGSFLAGRLMGLPIHSIWRYVAFLEQHR